MVANTGHARRLTMQRLTEPVAVLVRLLARRALEELQARQGEESESKVAAPSHTTSRESERASERAA